MDDNAKLELAQVLYWFMPVMVLACAGALLWCLKARELDLRALARHSWPGLISALALVSLCAAVLPPKLRVQFDESELVSASYSMHFARADIVANQALPNGHGGVMVVDSALARRPPLQPFFASIVHDLVGPSVENSFAVNLAALFALLALVFAVAVRHVGPVCAVAAQALVVSVPSIVLSACSAGFDLLALLLLALVGVAAIAYRRAPRTPRLALLVGLGCVYSYSRYEALPVFIVILIAALALAPRASAARRRLAVKTHWPLLLLVPLTAPLALTAVYALQAPEMQSFSGVGPRSLFEPLGALEHLAELLRVYFDPRPRTFFSGAADLCALAALALALKHRALRAAQLIPALCIGMPLAIVLLWHFGSPVDPVAARLFLGVAAAGALGPLALKARLGKRVPPLALLAFAVACLGLELRALAVDPKAFVPGAQILTEKVDGFLSGWKGDRGRTLFVTHFAPYLSLRGWLALYPESFVRNEKLVAVMRAHGDLRDVLLVETSSEEVLGGKSADVDTIKAKHRATVLFSSPDLPPLFVRRID